MEGKVNSLGRAESPCPARPSPSCCLPASSGHLWATWQRISMPWKGPGSLRGRHPPTSWPRNLGALCCSYHFIPPLPSCLSYNQKKKKKKLCQESRSGGQDCPPFLTTFTFGLIQKMTHLNYLTEFPQEWSENQNLTEHFDEAGVRSGHTKNVPGLAGKPLETLKCFQDFYMSKCTVTGLLE